MSSLTPGDHIGPYEVRAAVGAGGMGEVYRAHDTALGREVAIKVLPQRFAGDRERLARFEREGRRRPRSGYEQGIVHRDLKPANVRSGRTINRLVSDSETDMSVITGWTLPR